MPSDKSLHVKFEESGGGWTNPLLGSVFDSNVDIDSSQRAQLARLVEECDFSKLRQDERPPPMDARSFQLTIENEGRKETLTSDMVRADENLRKLVSFIRKHSRKELLK